MKVRNSRALPLAALTLVAMLAALTLPAATRAQRGDGARPRSVQIDPPGLTLEVGDSATLTARVRDASGEVLPLPVLFLTRDPRSLIVDPGGRVEAYAPGSFTVIARVPGAGRGGGFLAAEIEVFVPFPPLETIEIGGLPETLYSGVLVRPEYRVYDSRDALRDDDIAFASTDSEVLRVDAFGQLMPGRPGTATLRMAVGNLVEEIPVRVEENPVRTLELAPDRMSARTGDVVRFSAVARDPGGQEIEGLPVFYSIEVHPDRSSPGSPASGLIDQDGRFVAERPGRYTIVANAGARFATSTIEIGPRNVEQRLTVVGRGPVREHHTSDLWVWEGLDGRDYALTGTWGGNGEAYIWDVTDPEDITRIGEVRVDARTVNDVKVSEDMRLAVITREGASNRRNGIVILDVSDPANVSEISVYDAELTGGVHNVFIHQDHVYAVNNGTRYDVINVGEPASPFRVASFELETPGHSVHDVWIEDGIAYSSNWEDGVVLADVGNGIAGGAPDRPVAFASYRDATGLTHAAFPFRSGSTGRFYVIVGDESFPNGLDPQGPTVPAGYMHVVDFTDPDDPVEVARFEVPEAGSHNMWVEGDVLYAAFYNGGLRVVDLSGELMGDLYRQGREIAHFLPKDPIGVVPNESMVWGAQPHKGIIYLSDWNSGLWAVRLNPPEDTEARE